MIDLLIAALVQAAETGAAATPSPNPPAATAAPPASAPAVHCQWVLPTGSHIPQRVCMSVHDETRRTEDTEQDLHRVENAPDCPWRRFRGRKQQPRPLDCAN